MTDFGHYSTRRAQPGSYSYERLEPGETRVRDNRNPQSGCTFYKIPRGMRRDFRQWVRDIWSQDFNGEPVALFGQYGDIIVDRPARYR